MLKEQGAYIVAAGVVAIVLRGLGRGVGELFGVAFGLSLCHCVWFGVLGCVLGRSWGFALEMDVGGEEGRDFSRGG